MSSKESKVRRDQWLVCLLAAVWALIVFIRVSPSVIQVILSGRAVVWLPMLFLFALAIGMTWFGIISLILRDGRARFLTVFIPLLLCFAPPIVYIVQHPPSPQAYFEFYYEADFPSSAHNIKVYVPPPADPGSVEFYFECETEDCRKLIQQLDMTPYPYTEHRDFYRVKKADVRVRVMGGSR